MKSQLCICIILICISLQLHTTTAMNNSYLQLMSITSVDATDLYKATSENEYFCRNAFQVDLQDKSKFLVGICRPNNFQAVSSSSVIGTLPEDILVADPPYDYSQPMDEQYGNASIPAPSTAVDQYSWDGIGPEAQINFPEHLIQTPDGNIVYFIDIRSCLRKIDRTTGKVTTVIGVCLNGTLGIRGTADMNAYGVVYFEKEGRRIFVFTVTHFGIYVCYEETPGQEDYKCEQAMEYRFLSDTVAIIARMLTRGLDNYVWQKVRFAQFPVLLASATTTTTTATSTASTTTTTTTTTAPTTSPPASTPNIPAIALGVSTGLLAIALLILSLIHWNYRRNVGNNGGMVSSNRGEQHEHASNPMERNALQSGGGVGATSGNRGDNYTSLDRSRREEHAYATVEDGDMQGYEMIDTGQPARVNIGRNEQ